MKNKFFIVIVISLLVALVCSVYNAKGLSKVVYIDPGHGGIDGGCISNDGVYEKGIVLEISYYLKEYLEMNGYNVELTRYGDYDLASDNSNNRKHDDILRRVEIINKSKCDVVISIHANAFPNKNIKGAQCFYPKGNKNSELLSGIIQDKLNIGLANERISMAINNKYLLDNVKSTVALIEVGFLSNTNDAKNLVKVDYQKMIAYIIGDGVIEYLSI